jgi:hypothetical protein
MKRISKEKKEIIMLEIRKANSNEYETTYDEKGNTINKKKSNIQRGKNARAAGGRFELKVRKDLESKGKIVDKWTNNVDLEEEKIVQAKRKYNPFKKVMVIGTGFPDFVSIQHVDEGVYSVIGVEVKMNGILSKVEKEKCAWYLQNKIFSNIWIGKKGEKRGEIVYDDFLEKYGEKYHKI